jgi:uncharacterized protein (DUF2062 family)
MTAEDQHHQKLHFARIRRAKFWLRYMPRRARFHTYPVVGRFASFVRARSYLWRFHYPQIRPAFYLGSVLTLLPILGQLPIALVLCLIFRTNFMILGGLQLVSNFVTLPFIIPACYFLGRGILDVTGLDEVAGLISVAVPVAEGMPAEPLAEPSLVAKFVLYGSASLIGGLVAGLLLGGLLDLLWRFLVLPAALARQARRAVTATITPHEDQPSSPSAR